MAEPAGTPLRSAIDNNIGLYRAVLGSHGIAWTVAEEIAFATSAVPPLYSNLVTRSGGWRPDAVFAGIDRAAGSGGWSGWSVKDSFDRLDLSGFGFERLFGARWLHLRADRFSPTGDAGTSYGIVATADGLAEWLSAWGRREVTPGERIFRPDLLADPALWLVGGYESGRLVGGCLVNATDDVLGISNVFAPEESVSLWSGMIRFVFGAIGCRDIVGYKPRAFAERLGVLGFESPGGLAVWVKRRN